MTVARYRSWRPSDQARRLIAAATQVCAQHSAAGIPLTVSQAFYQLVRAGHLAGTKADRKRLGVVLGRARLAGLFDWDLLVDHTPSLHSADAVSRSSALVEVWVEKQALAGVVAPVAAARGVDWVTCGGLPSLTELRAAALRHTTAVLEGRPVVVLLLVDLDDLGHAVEGALRSHLHTMVATHWVDAHPQLLGRSRSGRGVALQVVEESMTRGLGGRPPLLVERVAVTRSQAGHLDLPADPDTGGYELDAVDPCWLREELDRAVAHRLVGADRAGAST